MGLHAYVDQVYIGGYRSITNMAQEWGVPAPHNDENPKDYLLYLTASDVKKWVDTANMIWDNVGSSDNGLYPLTEEQSKSHGRSKLEFWHVAQLMEAHAERYLYDEMHKLDEFDFDQKDSGYDPLTPRQRRDALRKATRKYRLIFG